MGKWGGLAAAGGGIGVKYAGGGGKWGGVVDNGGGGGEEWGKG